MYPNHAVATLVLLIGLLVLVPAAAQAQQTGNIEGTITSDATGEPLPGVNVLVKGTSTGTASDAEGNYSLAVPSEADTLVYSFVGYKSREVPIRGRATIDISLSSETYSAEEIIVTAYTSQRRSDITGAVATVEAQDIEEQSVTTVSEALEGRVAGLRVRSSGLPGQVSEVEIRGISNFGSNRPLYVIDGMPTNDTRDFNPQDVESIRVLKDAAAAALYGSRAANGVIVITTKKGVGRDMQVNFNGKYGTQNIARRYDLMSTEEWIATTNAAYENAGLDQLPLPEASEVTTTDWQDAIMKTGHVQEYNLSLSGGGEGLSYYLSGGHFRNEGAVVGPSFERNSVRVNSQFNKGNLKIQESLLLSRTESDELVGNPFIDAIRSLPITPVRDPSNASGFGYGSVEIPALGSNPIAQQRLNDNTVESARVQGTIAGEYAFTDYLRYKLNLGLEYNNSFFKNFREDGQWYYSQAQPISTLSETRSRFLSTLVESTLRFYEDFGSHSVTAIAGYTQQRDEISNTEASVRDLPRNSGGRYFTQLGAGASSPSVNGYKGVNALRSFLGRVEYDYDSKYLLTANIRRDGSSRFGENNRYGNFPSFSAGWRVSEESFFQELAPFITEMKLRGSYGKLGNQDIGNYAYQATINTNARYLLGRDGQVAPGSIQRNLVNENIKWESLASANVGLDLALLNNDLAITANYYISTSEDVLVGAPIPWTTGDAGGAPTVNAASVRNSGLEFSLDYGTTLGDFDIGVNANLTTIDNEVLELNGTGDALFGPNNTKTEVGRSIGEFFVIRTDGVFQSREEIENSAQPDAEIGDLRYRDIDGYDEEGNRTGEPDGVINAADRTYAGSPWPDLNYGLGIEASYKNVEFSMFWKGVQGHTLWNQPLAQMYNTADLGNYADDLDNSTIPTPEVEHGENVRGDTDRFLEDGSYLRLSDLRIGYDLPSRFLNQIGAGRKLEVYVSGQNLLTLTGYSGLDPAVKGAGILARGVDVGSFPSLRTFSVGVQVGL